MSPNEALSLDLLDGYWTLSLFRSPVSTFRWLTLLNGLGALLGTPYSVSSSTAP